MDFSSMPNLTVIITGNKYMAEQEGLAIYASSSVPLKEKRQPKCTGERRLEGKLGSRIFAIMIVTWAMILWP
jgi:hypothetical protein